MALYEKIKSDIRKLVSTAILLFLVYSIIVWAFNIGYDDTDSLVKKERSGMHLRIDHGTGCHYLEPASGGTLIPRMSKDGTHVCSILQGE